MQDHILTVRIIYPGHFGTLDLSKPTCAANLAASDRVGKPKTVCIKFVRTERRNVFIIKENHDIHIGRARYLFRTVCHIGFHSDRCAESKRTLCFCES